MPEAVIVSAARSPIGRANKGSLKDLRPGEVKATLNDVGENKVYDLEITGIGRCNGKDDKRADELFARAMKVLGR